MTAGSDAPDAWRSFCDRLGAVGERILGDDFPASDVDRAEGYRHLATQTVAWLSWAVGYGDPAFPAFFRQNDLVVRWGGPNVDQTTRRARVEPGGVYRVRGNLGACEDFILTLKTGDMFTEHYGICHEVTGVELGYGPGDDVDLIIGGDGGDAAGSHWVPLPDEARLLNLREYYWDWQPAAPAVFTIERLDTVGTAPPRLAPGRLATMLDEAATLIESSMVYWNRWVETERAKLPPNTMGPPGGSAGGSSRIRYSFGFTELEPDQALVITVDPAGARYRDIQLYSLAWFESLDFANRTTSLNHTQDRPSSDGLLHYVVAAIDPGVPNWLDTEGRRAAMVTQRWIGATGEPAVSSTVVPLADVGAAIPADTPRVDPEARRAEIAARQRHVAWRYRT